MVNLYHLLGLSETASAVEIQMVLDEARLQQRFQAVALDKIERCLLNPNIKKQYDFQLRSFLESQVLVTSPSYPHYAGVLSTSPSKQTAGLPLETSSDPIHNNQISKVSDYWSPAVTIMLEALVQPHKVSYYLPQFAKIERRQKAHFNWWALLGGGYWYIAKGLWLEGLAMAVLPLFLVLGLVFLMTAGTVGPMNGMAYAHWSILLWSVIFLIRFVYLPVRANALYYQFAQKKVAKWQSQYKDNPNKVLRLLKGSNRLGLACVTWCAFGWLTIPVVYTELYWVVQYVLTFIESKWFVV